MSSRGKLHNYLFLILFGSIFILAGIGLISVVQSHLLLIFLTITIPFFHITSKPIPLFFSIIYVLFLLYGFLILPFSFNYDLALFQLLIYSAVFLFCHQFYNDTSKSKQLIYFIGVTTTLFGVMFGLTLTGVSFPWLNSWSSEQFIKTVYGHNNIGHLAAFSSCIFAYCLIRTGRKKYFLFLLPFLILLFYSFSRTAYLAFFVTLMLVLHLQFRNKFKTKLLGIYLSIIIVFIALFLFVTSVDLPLFGPIQQNVQEIFSVPEKTFFSLRPDYWRIAVESVKNNPFGIGHGGYSYNYLRLTNFPNTYSTSAHNIFLDAFVSYGIIGGLLFLGIIMLLIHGAWNWIISKSKDLYTTALAYGFISFSISIFFDLVYIIPVFLALFFIVGIILYQDPKPGEITKAFRYRVQILAVVFCCFITFQSILSSFLFNNQRYKDALLVYPLRSSNFLPVIHEYFGEGNIKEGAKFLNWYTNLYGKDPNVVLNAGNIYKGLGLYNDADKKYNEFVQMVRFPYEPYIEMIYEFKSEFISKQSANELKLDYCSRYYKEIYFQASEICSFDD